MLPYCLVALTPLVSLVRLVRAGSLLLGDRSVFALQVADVVRGRFPSVGQYSWHGWNHPGPFAFYAFAPISWMTAGSSVAFFVGAASWSIVFGSLAIRTASRRHPQAGYAVVLLMCLTWFAAGRASSADPWTPYLALPVLVWFICGVWGTVERDRSAVWAMCISTAILVQLHVGYVPITTVVGLVALVSYWRGGGALTQVTRPMAGALVLFVPWLFHPTTSARNVADLVRYFMSDRESALGIERGLRILATEFSPHASWLGGRREAGVVGEAPASSMLWLLIPLVLLTGSVFLTRRVERTRRLAPCVIATIAMTAVSVAQIRGYAFTYVVLFRTPIVIAVIMWVIVNSWLHWSRLRRTLSGASTTIASAVLVAGCLLVSSMSAASHDTITDDARAVHDVVKAAAASVQSEPVLLRLGDGGLVGLYPELTRWFEHAGVDAGIERGTEWVFGDRAIAVESAAEVWFVCDTGAAFSLLSVQPGARVVAEHTPFTLEQEASVVALQSGLASQLRELDEKSDLSMLDSPLVGFALSGLAVDQEMAAELGVFNSRTPDPGDRFGIVAFSPEDVPDIWWSLDAPGTE